jgi:hypothetical protein
VSEALTGGKDLGEEPLQVGEGSTQMLWDATAGNCGGRRCAQLQLPMTREQASESAFASFKFV